MKTREKSVIVVVSDDGRMKRFVYPIAAKEGELMTRRLKPLAKSRNLRHVNVLHLEDFLLQKQIL